MARDAPPAKRLGLRSDRDLALGRAELVGAPTYGKGVSQRVSVGASGDTVRAEAGRVTLPGHAALDGVGLRPARG